MASRVMLACGARRRPLVLCLEMLRQAIGRGVKIQVMLRLEMHRRVTRRAATLRSRNALHRPQASHLRKRSRSGEDLLRQCCSAASSGAPPAPAMFIYCDVINGNASTPGEFCNAPCEIFSAWPVPFRQSPRPPISLPRFQGPSVWLAC
jgi:hypothetical protein